jgi:serine/threonine protein kinase
VICFEIAGGGYAKTNIGQKSAGGQGFNSRGALVLEDPGGVPVDQLLGRPLDVSHFLRVAVSLVAALRRAHERGLIRQDIKPANILVDAASGGVRSGPHRTTTTSG